MVRSELSENVEIEAGIRYSDLSDSDMSNTDVLLGSATHVTDYLTLRARGVVFDDDTGIEIGVRLLLRQLPRRDSIFCHPGTRLLTPSEHVSAFVAGRAPLRRAPGKQCAS